MTADSQPRRRNRAERRRQEPEPGAQAPAEKGSEPAGAGAGPHEAFWAAFRAEQRAELAALARGEAMEGGAE